MPKTTVGIPVARPAFLGVTLYYLEEFNNPDSGLLTFLHFVRKGHYSDNSPMGINYHSSAAVFAAKLSQQIDLDRVGSIACAPSSRNDNIPYYDELVIRFPLATKLGKPVSKDVGYKAGSGDTLEDALPHFHLDYQPTEPIESILIVDDVFARGLTAAVIVTKLQQDQGNRIDRIYVAVPLKT